MPTCEDAAKFFQTHNDYDKPLTLQRLQTLCAYAQAYAFALLDRPLFEGEVRSGADGDIVAPLPETFADIDSASAGLTMAEARQEFTDEELFVLETVNGYYGVYDTAQLRQMARGDFPSAPCGQDKIEGSEIREIFMNNNMIKSIMEIYHGLSTRYITRGTAAEIA